MADFGLGSKGFKRKQYADIIADMNLRARELFGEDINLSERSPLGLFIRLVAWFTSILWQLAEKVYNSGYIDTAEGSSLDHVVKYAGLNRRGAVKAKGQATITGDNGTAISAGFLVGTPEGINFITTAAATIGVSGEVTVSIEAVEPGIGSNVPSGIITEIINPLPGVDSVANNNPTTGGRNAETDPELRTRYFLSLAAAGASTIDAIRAALLRTEGVRAANVIENASINTDVDGRPPKSIECYVLGGQAADVAQTILDYKAAGIETTGTEQETVKDSSGQDRLIRFSFADVVNVYANIELSINPKFPIDGEERIKQKLAQYIGGEDVQGNVYAGLNMGENVIYTRLIDIIYNIEGIEDLSLEIGTDGLVFGTQNIAIAVNEVAETAPAKVVITYA